MLRKGLLLALLMTLTLAVSARAATKTYQVTGPVLEVRPDAIVVQKGTEKWEIARDPNTKAPADLKVGPAGVLGRPVGALEPPAFICSMRSVSGTSLRRWIQRSSAISRW